MSSVEEKTVPKDDVKITSESDIVEEHPTEDGVANLINSSSIDQAETEDASANLITSKVAAAPEGKSKVDLDVESQSNEFQDPVKGGNSRHWDHTNRRVMVQNVAKFLRQKEVEKLAISWLQKLKDPASIRITKVKKPPKDNWVVVTLEDESMVQPFIDLINNCQLKNRKGGLLHATRVESRAEKGLRSQKKKRKGCIQDDEEDDNKRQKQELPKTDNEIRDAITPLWRLTYEEQLQTKQSDMIKRSALKIVQEVKSKFRTLEKEARRNKNRKEVPMYEWLNARPAIHVKQILPSPKQTEYRNKCELNFGYNHQFIETAEQGSSPSKLRKTPVVGFMASGWSGGISLPHCCQNVPPEPCAIADIVNTFLSTSPIPPYDSRVHRGVWRTLTIRTSPRTNECMVIVMHAPPAGGAGARDETDDYSAVFKTEKDRLVAMLTEKELPPVMRQYPKESDGDEEKSSVDLVTQPCSLRVTSIYFQEFDGLSAPGAEHPVQHAWGKESIREKLGKCTFQISPGAFFQVNTEGAEVLYNVVVEEVKELIKAPQDIVLIDVCCGTGTIGLTCLKEGVVGRVVGVDISEPAINDAIANAGLNGFAHTDSSSQRTNFVASRAEHVLSKEIAKVRNLSSTIVAVVDPSREGLHPDVIKTLRANEKISRLIYVSCNPTGSLVRDAGLLCAPPTKKYSGLPFRPTSAQPLDMFPLTPHCEMVLTFDRIES